MAAPNGVYFPALDQCLKGDKTLLLVSTRSQLPPQDELQLTTVYRSWRLVASALQDVRHTRLLSECVARFLQEPYVHGLIKTPSKAFDKPTPQTKSAFETKTAAINVTPTSNDQYDIKTIKEDALWLTKNAGINEVDALRIVVIEFQARPQSHLSGALATQDAINIQQAVGADGTQANALLAFVNAADTGDAEKIWTDFNTETARRRRLTEFYLSERRHFTLFLDSFFDLILGESSGQKSPRALDDKLHQQLQQATFGDKAPRDVRNVTREELLATYLAALPECLVRAEKGPDSLLTGVDLELEWLRTAVTETLHLMAAVFQLVDLFEYFCPATIVSTWFKFADTYGFMDRVQGLDEQTAEVLQPLKNLTCVVSMKMLNLPKSILFLDGELPEINLVTANPQEDSYLASDQVLVQIHETVISAANLGFVTAGPVIFTWTLILQRMLRSHHERQEKRDLQQNRQAQEGFEREVQHVEARPGVGRRSSAGSIVSMETQSYDIFLNNEFGSSQQQQDLQNIEQLAIAVTAGGQMHNYITDMALSLGRGHSAAFRPSLGSSMRLVLLDFLTFSFPVVGYISESITAFLAVLTAGHGYWDIPRREQPNRQEEVVATALNDDMVIQSYIGQALLRYPHEFAPFTSLCKVISMSLAGESRVLNALLEARRLFLDTPTLTFPLPDASWEFTGDEADIGRLELVRDVQLFSVAPARKRLIAEDEPFCIPAGTQGQLASDAGRIVQLQYVHSTIALLGKRLEANLASDSYDLALGSLEADNVAEVVSLLATLICCDNMETASGHSQETDSGGVAILREASRALPRTKDIISIVCDTLDSYVDGDLTNLEAGSLRVMTACLEFLDSVLPICPGRVWSYMTRCDLLMSSSKAGRLSRITGTLELVDDRFDLLATVVRLFSNLVDSSVTGAVHRKMGSKANNGRSAENEHAWLGTSDKALSQVTLSIAHTAVDIFENTLTWRFSSEVHRSTLLGDLIPTLNSIVVNFLGIGNDNNANPLMAFLQPAAQYLVDGFLCSTPSSLRFQPLLSSMLVALGAPESTLYQRRAEVISRRQVAVLDFATTLIRVANLQEQPATAIEGQLLKCSSLLARLCVVNTAYRKSTLALLGALAERISRENSEAPSLLGYLGPQISRSFLQTISKLDKPFDRPAESRNAWAFFSTIMRNGQHWMANCLLTGKTPREALGGDGKLSKLAPDSILKTALTRLRSIRTLPTAETLAILDFLTSAHNYWQWTVFASQQDDSCLSELRAYVKQLKPAHVTAKSSASRACDEARIAAYIAEAFAMHLYHLRKTGREKEFAQELINDIDYYLRGGVLVDGYNSSLHANFAKNFAKQYPGFTLENFQRTLLVPRELGKDYYYALDLADRMMVFDPGWAGPREKNGFKSEMETANLNLSLVDAQIVSFFWTLQLNFYQMSKKPDNILGSLPCLGVSPPRTQHVLALQQGFDPEANDASRGAVSGMQPEEPRSRANLSENHAIPCEFGHDARTTP